MGLIGDWRAARERRRLAERYLSGLLTPTSSSDVTWLANANGDRARAIRELELARRAIALIVAERDALDDRTAADVAHALNAGADSAWSARWRAYSAALAVRGQQDAPAIRLARVLLDEAGVRNPPVAVVEQATHFVQEQRGRANESLRAVFGVASLPEDIRPSALKH